MAYENLNKDRLEKITLELNEFTKISLVKREISPTKKLDLLLIIILRLKK